MGTIFQSIYSKGSYDLVRLNRSSRGGGVVCYIKILIPYSYKDSIFRNIESIFAGIYLPKYKPMLLDIFYRPPSKSDFAKHINNVFTETGVLDIQECFLTGNLIINLFFEER